MNWPRLAGAATLLGIALAASPARADVAACVAAANEGGVLRREVAKLTTARARLRVCAADDCPTEIRDDCRSLLAELEAQIPSVVAVAEDSSGSTLTDVALEIDDVRVAERLDGLPIDVDAGTHRVVFVRGGERLPADVVVAAGKKNQEVRVRFANAGAPAPTPTTSTTTPSTPDATPSSGDATWKWVGLGAAGVGLVGLGLGTVFGLRASSLQDEAGCPNNVCRDEASKQTHLDARSAGNLSTLFFVAGGVLVASGVTLWFVAPDASASARARREGAAPRPFLRRAGVTPLSSGAAMVFEVSL